MAAEPRPPADVQDFLLRRHGRRFRVALDLHYDLEHPDPAKLRFRYLWNRLIHHLAFDVRPLAATDDLELLFTDTEHKKTLHGIALEAYIALVLEAHYDEIRWVGFDEKGKRIRDANARLPEARGALAVRSGGVCWPRGGFLHRGSTDRWFSVSPMANWAVWAAVQAVAKAAGARGETGAKGK